MSRREEAKTFNRARICATAEAIIRGEGMDKLTMRRLAEVAGVSLRTPYNLFGSKTDVLLALLDEAGFEFAPHQAGDSEAVAIAQLFGGLDRVEAFFASDEEYYRGIYAAIMTSDHPEVRSTGVGRAVTSAQALVAEAVAHGELSTDTDAEGLGRHLAIALLAVLGMWGSGLFSNRESIAQVRRAWLAVLLQHGSDAAHPGLAAAYQDLCTPETDR